MIFVALGVMVLLILWGLLLRRYRRICREWDSRPAIDPCHAAGDSDGIR